MLKTRHRLLPAQYRNGITFVWYIQIFLFIDPKLKICLPDVLLTYLKSLYASLKLKASFFGKTNIADIINIMKLKDKNQHHFSKSRVARQTVASFHLIAALLNYVSWTILVCVSCNRIVSNVFSTNVCIKKSPQCLSKILYFLSVFSGDFRGLTPKSKIPLEQNLFSQCTKYQNLSGKTLQ